jgi:hypothetical protein
MAIRRFGAFRNSSSKKHNKLREQRRREAQRSLLMERLEDRMLLDAGGFSSGDEVHPFPDGLNHPDPVVRELIAGVTTTDSQEATYSSAGGGFTGSTAESGPLIDLDKFRSDPNYAGVDGSGFAAVIMDTGIDLDHPFFGPDTDGNGVADRIVYNQDFIGGSSNAQDVHGHGSNVSSIVTSSDATYPGMAPGADIIHLKVLGDSGAGSFGAAESALQWVIANAATYNIASINMSLGDPGNYNAPTSRYGLGDEMAALVAMDVIVVSASGNDFAGHGSAQGVSYPSADPNSLSIGAVFDSDIGAKAWGGAVAYTSGPDRVVPFSQRHDTMTSIFAPGAPITGAGPTGGTVTMDGTSQASPHIAGIAVLAQDLAEEYLGRRLTQAEFVGLLDTTGVSINDGDDEDDSVNNTGLDFKRVDMYALAQAISGFSGPVGEGLGPLLVGVQPNDGDLLPLNNIDDDGISQIGVRNVAPNSLTLRFDENQQIDPNTLGGVRVYRAGFDGEFQQDAIEITPGYMGVGDAPNENEIIIRFAESLPDDLYRIELIGIDDAVTGDMALRNNRDSDGDGLGQAVGDRTNDRMDNGETLHIDFELELGPQVVAVVPQPVQRIPVIPGSSEMVLQQAQDQIVVYFNNDDLFVENDALGNPTPRSAENTAFYQLIFTNDSVDNLDDIVLLPISVDYSADADTATLTFAQNLDELVNPSDDSVIGPGTFRLRVGTNEETPTPPVQVNPVAEVQEDFNTGGAAVLTFTANGDLGKAINVSITKDNLGLNVLPAVSVAGTDIHIVLNKDDLRTAGDLMSALQANAAVMSLVTPTLLGDPATDITVPASEQTQLRVSGLGSSFETATDLGDVFNTTGSATSQHLLISSAIDPQEFLLDYPGSPDEPGHRQLPDTMPQEQHVNPAFGPDTVAGVTTVMYNFRLDYGFDADGTPLENAITLRQKDRIREVVELWGDKLGVQFMETPDQGLTIVTGDLNVLNTSDPTVINEWSANLRVRTDPTFDNGMLIIDSSQQWDDEFAAEWFDRAMIGFGFLLGLQRTNDLPVTNLMSFNTTEPYLGGTTGFLGFNPPEPIYPGNADVLHGQFIHRPDGNDIDLYRFEIDLQDQSLDEAKTGLLTVESFAERLPNSSPLDTVLSLYHEVEVRDRDGNVVGYERELIARNDDYYSSDSFLNVELGSGTYYIGVTAGGNTDFDPVLEDTGSGGTSQGEYDIRLSFRSQVDDDDSISDQDRLNENRPGTRLDGDADGTPGGVYNFWFQTRPQYREISITGSGAEFVDGQTLTLEDGGQVVKRFEFDNDNSLMNSSAEAIPFGPTTTAAQIAGLLVTRINTLNSLGFGVSAQLGTNGTSLILSGDRVSMISPDALGIELAGKTTFVDKTSGSNLDGSLQKPFDNIGEAFAAAAPGDIVRIVGNGGIDNDHATLEDNFAYEVGLSEAGAGNPFLDDGSTMEVPRGVTAMIDAGAIFKMRRSRVGVGSSTLTVDRSVGALQVLGTPHLLDDQGDVVRDAAGNPVPGSVYFTSRMDESIGEDGTPATTAPSAGDWGGIVFRADLDNAESRFNYEREGIFLNYVNHADMRYGGGLLKMNSVDQVVNPIQIVESRPTITFNTITNSADSAISADPNSFEETNFHSPTYQLNRRFTLDYQRVGPDITANHLTDNSINGLFVRIATPAGVGLKSLTVPGRFDDTDIVHVLAENLKIQGQPGQALLETTRPSVDVVTLAGQSGGQLTSGDYTYKVVFVDENGFEGRPSEATTVGTVGVGQGTLIVENLPPVSGNFVTKRLYRSEPGGAAPYHFVADLNASSTSFRDPGTVTGEELHRDPPTVQGLSLTALSASGTLGAGVYNYRILFADSDGNTSPASDASQGVLIGLADDAVQLTGIAQASGSFTKRLIYRSAADGSAPYVLVGELANTAGNSFTDDGTTLGDELDPTALGVIRARPDARLKIDPGTVVKLEGARIEVTFGAQLIAEGHDGQEVIFTSKLDDKYGAGGTFDTNGDDGPNEADPARGDWGGLYIGYLGQVNIDHGYIAHGGGNDNKIEGTFKGFNVIELHQADARIANSVIENNADGTGGQGPNDRFGRGPNDGATIFVRGSQPILLNNTIQNNADVAIDLNVDSLTDDLLSDPGRTTGMIDQTSLYRDNRGPLVRGNKIANNGPVTNANLYGTAARCDNLEACGTNGMEIRTAGVVTAAGQPQDGSLVTRGITLSSQSVWDDTDIVHILYDEVRVPDFHADGGLRLQSSPDESLVVKLWSPPISPISTPWFANKDIGNAVNDEYNQNPWIGAGFSALGQESDIDDRIGGTIYVVGQPGFPVILTSIHDDTVGAGVQPNGMPQNDTNNNLIQTTPEPGDWRSVRLDQDSHDRNVELVLEQESSQEPAPGINATVTTAQLLGDLAASETAGDENLRMGFEIQGMINSVDDVDVYAFTAVAGTEIWLDIDRTLTTLDTVIEVLNSDGELIALSDNSLVETLDPDALYTDPAQIPATSVNPLQKLAAQYQPLHASGLEKDFWSTNTRDAGMRIVLPGVAGTRSAYMFRVRSSNLSAGDSPSDLLDEGQVHDGLTSGVYQLQLRTQEKDEVPGSTVRYADIRYAQNGVEVIGLPKHSPLLGEAAEDENVAEDDFGGFFGGGNPASNDSTTMNPGVPGQRPQDLGNLLSTDRAVLSIAGELYDANDIDFYNFSVRYEDVSSAARDNHAALTFDMDYADGLGRADSTITIFQVVDSFFGPSIYTPVLIGQSSNIADDRSAPIRDDDDLSGVWDLSRGSIGALDPFIGSVELPEGDYAVAVTSNLSTLTVLDPEQFPSVRIEPIDSLVRVAEDHIGSYGGSTAEDPLVPVLLDPAFVGTGDNQWHVSSTQANAPGHGLTRAFDGSRFGIGIGNVGFVNEAEPNNSVGAAQSIEGSLWSLNPDPNITASDILPHMTIAGSGDDTVDYYSFFVPAPGSRAIFDVDFGYTDFPFIDPTSVDTNFFLMDSSGTYLPGTWSTASLLDQGSTSIFDPYLEYTFTTPGTYYIAIGGPGFEFLFADDVIPTGATYTLHVSMENHTAVTSSGSGGETFYFGDETTGAYASDGVGDLVSNAFSLADYSAGDKPVVYFNYKLGAESGDHFTLGVQRDGWADPITIGSSNQAEFNTAAVTKLIADDFWHQARIELDQFAGLDQLRLVYSFEADGDAFTGSGIHIDDVVIGFAERGEMITNAPNVATFESQNGSETSGPYQLEIRKSTQYGTSINTVAGNGLVLDRSYDTNDRFVQQSTLIVPPGADLNDGDTFRLGDGANVVTFEYDSTGGVGSGHVRIAFTATDPDYVIAARIRDAINSDTVQSLLRLQAVLSDGTASGQLSRSNHVVLFGNASGDIIVQPADLLTITGVVPGGTAVDDGNSLRAALLGSGLEPVGQADLIGGSESAGFFAGGGSSIGIDSGIILSTGGILAAEGPNLDDNASGLASGAGDPMLDGEFGVSTIDSTSLAFQFNLPTAGTVYFDYVFASEEYNELVGDLTSSPDAFAVFVNGANYALIPGTSIEVSRETISDASHSDLYNNNDPNDGGQWLRELGYDGFTDILRAEVPLSAGIHTVKFVISDVDDQDGDSAVLILGGSFDPSVVDPPQGIHGVLHDGFGDQNVFRDQGQTLIHSNQILNSADFGIVADAGDRDEQDTNQSFFFLADRDYPARLGQSNLGPVRNLREVNDRDTTGIQGGFAPGVVISNNTIAGEGLGGIHFSGDLAPIELTVYRSESYDNFMGLGDDFANATAGDAVCDGDWFSVTVGRTTVEFEFEDVNNTGDDQNRKCRIGGAANPGWEPGRVPVYYERTIPTNSGFSEFEMAEAVKHAIDNSILVTNGTTLVARTFVAPSRSVGDETGLVPTGTMTTPEGDWAVYVENAREVSVYGSNTRTRPSQVFENVRVTSLAHAAQPFGRIVNNTIHGNDGSEAFFTGDPMDEPNDTIFNAIDTRQGRAATPEVYTDNGIIGDNTSLERVPSSDVDTYQFHLDIGDHVVINVSSSEFRPQLRLFNSIGEELKPGATGAPFGSPTLTTGSTSTMEFYAEKGDTYFVGVSGPGNYAYSPLSMGSRAEADESGAYNINVNVMAPREWVIDTRMLVNASVPITIYDVNGGSFTTTNPATGNTVDEAWRLAQQIDRLAPHISATSYGGRYNGEPQGSTFLDFVWLPQSLNGTYERFVVVKGASKIEGLNADAMWPILGTNNDDNLLPETGILISEEATPTLLNNVLSNNRNAIIETANQPDTLQRIGDGASNNPVDRYLNGGGSSPDVYYYPSSYALSPISAVVGAELYQHNEYRALTSWGVQMRTGNWGISDVRPERSSVSTPRRLLTESIVDRPDNEDFNIQLDDNLPLFVNAAAENYFPAPFARSIDSSVAALEDRDGFLLVKTAMGIANSPVLAPERDSTGQLRIDDPDVSSPQGQGQNVFIDRGSLDRSDFVGPVAVLINPRDNDTDGMDIDPADTVVQLTDGVWDSFLIQLIDGFEIADPFPGVGVDDNTVMGPEGPEGRLPGAAVTLFQNGVFLLEGVDYGYRYDPVSNTIRLEPTAGIWPDDKVYVIKLNNRDRYVINAPVGNPNLDGEFFQITDDEGTRAIFEYDSGYTLQVPESLYIQLPAAGVSDGQRFVVRNGNAPGNPDVVFELDVNGFTLLGNIPVHFNLGASEDEIADAMVAALTSPEAVAAGLDLQPKNIGEGRVHLGAPEHYTLDTDLSSLIQPATSMTLAVPEVVADGVLTIRKSGVTLNIEFDSDGIFDPANQIIDLTVFTTPDEIADQIVIEILGSNLNVTGTRHDGAGFIYVDEGDTVQIDVGATLLYTGGASRPVSDGETFVFQYDDDANDATPTIDVEFQLDRDNDPRPGSDVVIDFTLQDTNEEVGEKIALAIRSTTSLDLPDAKHLEDGVVFIGGTIYYDLDVSASPTLVVTGTPDITPTTTLNLPGVPTIVVPANGGLDITAGDTFTITDGTLPAGLQTQTFEFVDPAIPVSDPRNWRVDFIGADADQLAQNIISAINNVVIPGETFLAGVTPTDVDGNVELVDANSFHDLDTTNTPNLGQTGGSIGDGETFRISYEGNVRTFEFDNDGNLNDNTNIPILLTVTSTVDEIGATMVAAIVSQTALALPNAEYVGNGAVVLHDTSRHDTILPVTAVPIPPEDSLVLTGIPGGAVRLPFEPWSGFDGDQMASVIVDAINGSGVLLGVTASVRGGNTLFVEFRDANNEPADLIAGAATVQGISNYFLQAIQDVPGNWLKANQHTDDTQFTILMPGAQVDFGDAPDSIDAARYPTLFVHNGARHVISDTGLFLGSRVDADSDGQPIPAAFGDDLDHLVDLGTASISMIGLSPYTIQVPATGVVDKTQFTITPQGQATVTFEFFDTTIQDNTLSSPGYVAVFITPTDTIEQIADAIVSAVNSGNVGLAPVHLGDGVVYLGGTSLQDVDARNSHVTASGVPVNMINAVFGGEIADGEQITIDDGVSAPVIFEFDRDEQWTFGTRAITYDAGDTAVQVAGQIETAINAAKAAGLLDVSFVINNLDDGRLHVSGMSSHDLDLGAEGAATYSGLTYSGYTPVQLQIAGAGLGLRLASPLAIEVADSVGGGIMDGQTFTIADGTNQPVIFEFDKNSTFDPYHRRIVFDQFDSGLTIAQSIQVAIDQAVADGVLNPVTTSIDATGPSILINIDASAQHWLDTSDSGLGQSGAVASGETFTIDDGVGGSVTFEFVRSGGAPTINAVVFQDTDSANDIANALVAAVQASIANLELDSSLSPYNYGGGDVQIGGDVGSSITVAAANLTQLGTGGGMLDGQTFTLYDGVQIRRFEFDADNQSIPGNITIGFSLDSTADEMAAAVQQRIEASGFAQDLIREPGGVLRIEGDDEDGVRFEGVFTPGANVPITVTASAEGLLDAWIDYNNDGDFKDQYEHIFDSVALDAGENQLVITIPSTVIAGDRYSRFRFSTSGGLAPTGLATDGEVEDHVIPIYTNDPPVLDVPGMQWIDEDLTAPIPGIVVIDVDSPTSVIHVTLTVINGTLDVNTAVSGGLTGADVLDNGTASVTLVGWPEWIRKTLADPTGLEYTGNLNYNGPDLLTVVANDQGNEGTGGPQEDRRTVPITVNAINDAPVLTVVSPQTVDEDVVLDFPASTISVFDVEYAQEEVAVDTPISVTLSVANGVLTIRDDVPGGVLPGEITYQSVSEITLLAPPSRINVTLAVAGGLSYDSNPDVDSDDVLTVTANDLGNLGSGGAHETEETIAIEIHAINDAPVVTAPTVLTALEDTTLDLLGFDVSDVDSRDGDITVTLRVTDRTPGGTNGTVEITAVAGGVDLADVTGNGTSLVTITAPVSQISTTLSTAGGWTYEPPANFAGNVLAPATEKLIVTANDNGNSGDAPDNTAEQDSATVLISVLEINDPPAITAPADVAAVEDIAVAIGGISVNDPDAVDDTTNPDGYISVTLKVGYGLLSVVPDATNGVPAARITGIDTDEIVLLGSENEINATLAASVTYLGDLNFNSEHLAHTTSGSEALIITANDRGNSPAPAEEFTLTVAIDVAAVNDAPVVSMPDALSVNEDMDLRIPAIKITDPDTMEQGADGRIRVTMTLAAIAPDVQVGMLTVNEAVSPGVVVMGSPGATVTLEGTLVGLKDIFDNPRGIVYRGDPNSSGEVLLTVNANDLGNSPGPAQQDTQLLTITVNSVNDAPVITVPGQQTVDEDTDKLITGVSVADVDIAEETGTGQITVILNAASGTITVDQTAGTIDPVADNGQQSVTLKGLLDEVNSVLAVGITYRGLENFNADDIITVTAKDGGNWPAPERTSQATIDIDVTPQNDPPVISAPGEQTVNEDQLLNFPPITISDPDANEQGSGVLTVDLGVDHGTLTVAVVAGGVVDIQQQGPTSVTLVGTLSQLNTTLTSLSGLTYLPDSNINTPDSLTIEANDGGNTGGPAETDTATVPISIVAINDAPIITMPATPGPGINLSTDEDVSRYLVFPDDAVVDVDLNETGGSGLIYVRLTVEHGTLTVSEDFGLTIGGNSSSSVEFSGLLVEVNDTLSALDGVEYSPDENFNGTGVDADLFSVFVDDLGNTDANAGTGNANHMTDQDALAIDVIAVNDPPVLTIQPTEVDVDEDTDLALSVSVVDVDAAENTGELEMTLEAVFGTITVDSSISGGVGTVFSNGGKNVVLVGTPDQLNTTFAQDGVVYRGDPEFYTSSSISVEELIISVKDNVDGQINTGPIEGRDQGVLTITVNPVNDPPEITISAPPIVEDVPAKLTITVDDAEIGDGIPWIATLSSPVGTFTVPEDVAGGVPANDITDNGTGTVVLNGTGSQIKATLESLEGVFFQGNKDFASSGELSIKIDDLGPDGVQTPGAPTDDAVGEASLTITVSGVNDAPEITLPVQYVVDEDTSVSIGGANGASVVDVDSGTGLIRVTLVVDHGKLTIKDTVPGGLEAGDIQGNRTDSVTLLGTAFAIGETFADSFGVRYQAVPDWFGQDLLTVTADDRGFSGTGGALTDTLSVPINVIPVNDGPIVVNPVQDFTVDEDAPNTLIELFPGVFSDPDDTELTLTVANSDTTLINATVSGTQLTLDYLTNQGGRSATITILASDGEYTAQDTFVVTVTSVDDSPFVANPIETSTVPEGTTTTVIDLTDVFDDPDLYDPAPNQESLTLSFDDGTDNTNQSLVRGVLDAQAETLTLLFTPNQGGRAELTVHVTDSTGLQASETFAVKVDLPPTARDDQVTTDEDTSVDIDVTTNDFDADGFIDVNSVAIVTGSGPSDGTVEVVDGVVTYTPRANYHGMDSFRYTVLDNEGFMSDEATVSITVDEVFDYQNPLNDADVNRSGEVSPIDLLIDINQLNTFGTTLPDDPAPGEEPEFYYDVNGDGYLTSTDILTIITELNRLSGANGEGEAPLAGEAYGSQDVSLRPLDDGVSLLAVPDYSQPLRVAPAVTLVGDSGMLPTDQEFAQRTEQSLRDEHAAKPSAFETLGDDVDRLLDVDLDDVLGDIAEDIGGAGSDPLSEDWVLQGFGSA